MLRSFPTFGYILFFAAIITGAAHAQDRVNVIFEAGVSPLEQNQILIRHGAAALKQHSRFHATTVNASSQSQTALAGQPGVTKIEPDYIYESSTNPNQAAVPADGGASATTVETVPTGVDRIDAEPGKSMNAGTGVVVAIVDTGCDLTHPDLAANIVGNYNAITTTKNGNDDNGHGSHCGGIVAAVHNTQGVVGVACEAKLLAVKVLDRNGSGYSSDIAEGIDWATTHGAKVINMSLGAAAPSSLIQAAVERAAAANVVIVCAAGNSGPAAPGSSDVLWPAAFPECIAVSAWTDLDGTPAATGAISPWGDLDESLASFSCTGPEVEITAPGVNIYSTWKSGGYNTISGTSMASPHVAGVIALLIVAGEADPRAALAARADHVAGTPAQVGAGLARGAPPPNTAPVVIITAPVNGAHGVSGALVTLTATASDTQDGNLTAVIAWQSDRDGTIGNGGTRTVVLSDGTHNLTASVTDAGGLTTTTGITFIVDPNTPPVVTITDPAAGGHGLSGHMVTLTATATDAQNGDLAAAIAWQSDRDGNLGSGGTRTVVLSEGQHNLTAAVTDAGGLTTTVGVTFTVDPNTAPVVTITAPVGGTHVASGALVSFTATAADTEDGDLASSILWHSDRDGDFGTGATLAATLTDGTHNITAVVTDAGGLTTTATLTFTVDAPPPMATVTAITYSAPTYNKNLLITTALRDNLNNPVAGADVAINLYRNGVFYATYKLKTDVNGLRLFIAINAPGGVYTTTVKSIVAAGLTWDGVTPPNSFVKPNTAPAIAITAPVSGTHIASGAPVTFSATASDLEDGNIASAVTWKSDRDGDLGTGATLAAILSDGKHTITASVTDAGGLTAKVAMTLVAGPQVTVASVTYAAANGGSDLRITVTLQDDLGNPVAGAIVQAKFLLNGVSYASRKQTTGSNGAWTFVLLNAPAGSYSTRVQLVTATGLTWDGVTPPNSFTK